MREGERERERAGTASDNGAWRTDDEIMAQPLASRVSAVSDELVVVLAVLWYALHSELVHEKVDELVLPLRSSTTESPPLEAPLLPASRSAVLAACALSCCARERAAAVRDGRAFSNSLPSPMLSSSCGGRSEAGGDEVEVEASAALLCVRCATRPCLSASLGS
mgnify:FL=1